VENVNKILASQEDFTQMVIQNDIKCPRCGAVVIKANKVIY
jgi:ribosomal protein S27AE